MTKLNQNNLILVNDETSMRNPDFSTVIYLAVAKVAQRTLLYYNSIENEESIK